ncbi:tachykinin-4 [Orycteropus afer afer]|uniref:Tachykinin-4 n=1 Tax=Orycteropus afer afer TaxID=1230840 RepID=A0AC54Z2M5_ORYAF|nr:tachykinin-4 [Orycteropus afer afer]
MLLCLTLILLMGLSVCTMAGDSGEELTLGAEVGPWVTVTLEEEGIVASIQLQFQEVKRGKASQFFGLMGKRMRGYEQEQAVQGLLGKKGPSTGELSPDPEEDQGPE